MQDNPIDIYIATCPVPYKYKEELHAGFMLKEDKYCTECKNRICDENLTENLFQCPSKMLSKKISKNGIELQIFGFSKKTESYSRNSIDFKILNQWLQGLDTIIEYEFEQKKMMWAPFHDITPCIAILFRNIESIVAKYPGETINEKIENQENPVPYPVVRLFKTTSLLDEQLKMIRYMTSDGQISSGRRNSFPIYKVIDKIQKVFKVFAIEHDVDIEMHGRSFNAPYLFDSFSSVPFILLDNAIKYTLSGEKIQISVFDIDNGGVEFSISSLSTICDDHIFEKQKRGIYSQQLTDRGMGMGLYIAKQICDVNNASISHLANNDAEQIYDEIPYCLNTFKVKVHGLS